MAKSHQDEEITRKLVEWVSAKRDEAESDEGEGEFERGLGCTEGGLDTDGVMWSLLRREQPLIGLWLLSLKWGLQRQLLRQWCRLMGVLMGSMASLLGLRVWVCAMGGLIHGGHCSRT
jgi:hypothetical protein